MTFLNFMELYDDWNRNIKVNDDNLNPIIEGMAVDIMLPYGDLYNSKIMDKEVISFGYYNNTLCIRIK